MNSQRIGLAINQVLSWGNEEGLTLDPSNSELLHLSRRRRDRGLSPQVLKNGFSISENIERPSLNWLGVHFDKKLTFKFHAQIHAAKALKLAKALRCLGNTVRGVPPYLSRQAVIACVLPIVHFGAETWWSVLSRQKRNKIISNRVGQQLIKLDQVHRIAARAILSVYRTAPSPAILREAGLSTAEIALDNISRRAAVRARKLDPYLPLHRQGKQSFLTPALTRFSHSYR
ncbi:hypothetical protein K3495_g10360 [Podosphaera aphanis]|nr:hypothetical protein K3495_g10360 [Podosphaera aphanis]